MATLSDTFTDTDGTAITAHTSNSGHTYSRHSSYTSDQTIIADAFSGDGGRIHHTGGTSGCSYSSFIPSTQDQYSEVTFFKRSSSGQFGPAVRIQTGANTMYWVRYNTGNSKFELCSIVAGTITIIAASSATTLNVDQSYLVRLTVTGTTVGDSLAKVDLDGTTIISLQGNVDVTANGRIGFRSSTSNTNTTGFHIGSVSADVSSGSSQTITGVGTSTKEDHGSSALSSSITETCYGRISTLSLGANSINSKSNLNYSGKYSTQSDGAQSIISGSVSLFCLGTQTNEASGISSLAIGTIFLSLAGLYSNNQNGVSIVSSVPNSILNCVGLYSNNQSGVTSTNTVQNLILGCAGLYSSSQNGTAISNAGLFTAQMIGISETSQFGVISSNPGVVTINQWGRYSNLLDGVSRLFIQITLTAPTKVNGARLNEINSARKNSGLVRGARS